MIYENPPRTEAMISPWRDIKKNVRRQLTALFTKQGDPVIGQYWDDCPSDHAAEKRTIK